MNLLKRSKELAVEFCERCARVRDSGCRAAAIRVPTRVQALRLGVRI